MNEPLLEARQLSKSYGEVVAVRPLDLVVESGDFCAILGPSGCGKTTLLRMIGGFVPPSSGQLLINGHDVTRVPPERRPSNMVFQGYGLFPHMNVRENIGYGLRLARVKSSERNRRVAEMLDLVEIGPLADRMINALSGGQQQRVALARALVMRPQILLLDEPLAALDLKLRASMQEELRRLHRDIGGTFLFVTHDQGEAMALANRIAVMRDGRIEQQGTPEEVYLRPANAFVATFLGEANQFAGHRVAGRITLDAGPAFANVGKDGPVTVIVRHENMCLHPAEEPGTIALTATVTDRVFLGTHTRWQLRGSHGGDIRVQVPGIDPKTTLTPGAEARVGWRLGHEHVLDLA